MNTVAILGSTGSIGKSTLQVIGELGEQFGVVALAAGKNTPLFSEQINKFAPQVAAIMEEAQAATLQERITVPTKILTGVQGIEAVAAWGADIVVMAIGGGAALLPTLKALEKSKRLALANKESLVMAGDIVLQKARDLGREIIPVDSEHSAIFQCLKGEERKSLDKIYLTCSGGPLQDLSASELQAVQPELALHHPRWEMGKRISIDSATLMNKGLELFEAIYLFGLLPEKIKILIHPQALVHSLVQFVDGSILAQLSVADMRLPIQYALTYPRRLPGRLSHLDFSSVQDLSFQLPDLNKFPCLKLAIEAAKAGGLAGAVLNASDEECVRAYLSGQIQITEIARIIEAVLAKMRNKSEPALDEILSADQWAREETKKMTNDKISRLPGKMQGGQAMTK